MGHKSPKIEALLERFDRIHGFDRHYVAFFQCFNAQIYFEAHEVLEEIWLPIRGGEKAKFYQGLIQVAGAFVHFQKNRLGPAGRLLTLALNNFEAYPNLHEGIDLRAIRELCREHRQVLIDSGETINPWRKENAPRLDLPSLDLSSQR